MWKWVHKYGSPKTCYQFASRAQRYVALACLCFVIYGLFGGLLAAPPDYQQGNVYRIIYLHVPLAIGSLVVYMVMVVAVIFFLIWKIKVADIIAKVSAPIGAVFAFLTLVTGAIWGKPTWGAWWVWDARLTSELILLFIYLGIIALRSGIPEGQLAARATGIMTLVGVVNIPIIHYSVNWWNTLHQGSTILQLRTPTIAMSMLFPLLAMIAALLFYYLWVLLVKVRCEILLREQQTVWVREILGRVN